MRIRTLFATLSAVLAVQARVSEPFDTDAVTELHGARYKERKMSR